MNLLMNKASTSVQAVQRSEAIRRTILRVHSGALMLVAVASTANAMAGHFGGVGAYAFLRENPLAYVGLHQAYLLMLVVATTMWFGAAEPNTRRWHMVAILAHSAVLTAVLLDWNVFPALGFGKVALGSAIFHSLWIVVEASAASFLVRRGDAGSMIV